MDSMKYEGPLCPGVINAIALDIYCHCKKLFYNENSLSMICAYLQKISCMFEARCRSYFLAWQEQETTTQRLEINHCVQFLKNDCLWEVEQLHERRFSGAVASCVKEVCYKWEKLSLLMISFIHEYYMDEINPLKKELVQLYQALLQEKETCSAVHGQSIENIISLNLDSMNDKLQGWLLAWSVKHENGASVFGHPNQEERVVDWLEGLCIILVDIENIHSEGQQETIQSIRQRISQMKFIAKENCKNWLR